jgi:hypothetical protein
MLLSFNHQGIFTAAYSLDAYNICALMNKVFLEGKLCKEDQHHKQTPKQKQTLF